MIHDTYIYIYIYIYICTSRSSSNSSSESTSSPSASRPKTEVLNIYIYIYIYIYIHIYAYIYELPLDPPQILPLSRLPLRPRRVPNGRCIHLSIYLSISRVHPNPLKYIGTCSCTCTFVYPSIYLSIYV